MLKEKMALVSRDDDPNFVVMLDHVSRPAKEILPVVAARLPEDVLPVAAGDHINAFPGLLILRLMIKSHDVGFVRRKIDILHGA
ncbi:hypothetical protein D3C75_1215180 [compost metagenome]